MVSFLAMALCSGVRPHLSRAFLLAPCKSPEPDVRKGHITPRHAGHACGVVRKTSVWSVETSVWSVWSVVEYVERVSVECVECVTTARGA